MNKSGNFAEKWAASLNSTLRMDEVVKEAKSDHSGMEKAKRIFNIIARVIFHLRKIVMAIPVVYYALKLAAYNSANLPEMVGLRIQADGSYLEMISRATAVNGCLMITAVCLGMMFLSRKTVYPWVISIFSLIVPIFLMITNLYPC